MTKSKRQVQPPHRDNKVGILGDGFAWLEVANAAVITEVSSKTMFDNPDADPKDATVKGKTIKYIPWGSSDDTPNQVIKKTYKNPTTGGNIEFNIILAYGDGIMPVRRIIENNQLKFVPVIDNKEINTFLDDNDINGYLLEQSTDFRFFFNVFPEIILSRDDNPSSRKVVEINHKEASFSRWTEMNAKGKIENHLYCSKFGTAKTIEKDDIDITPVLDPKHPILDLKRRMGLEMDLAGKKNDEKQFRYIVPITFPTPGRSYYQKPYWYSIFESGWFDYAVMIPEYKVALLKNQMVIKYVVYVAPEYWAEIFAKKGITSDDKKKEAAMKEEYNNIQDFLAGHKNSGKAVISKLKYMADGKEVPYIKIVAVENPLKGGGEFIQDSEEVSNLISFGMGSHQGIIGSSPDKNKTISGSEARELFTIKQAIIKPFRDRLLLPLYLAKAINKWPDDIFFTIPNVQLTTLDKNTGAEKVISQPAL